MSETLHTSDVQRFLSDKLQYTPTDVLLIGEGAWSRCFAFRHHGEDLVIRFGKYVDDFEKDRRAFRFATTNLPIPHVRDIGSCGDNLYFAISTRVYGVPLESVSSEQWRAIVPSLAAAMEAMRLVDLSGMSGIGGWGKDGHAQWATWSKRLLAVNMDTPDHRTCGWCKRLAKFSPEGEAAFAWGYDLLREFADDAVPRSLLHCDMTNRNVFVEDNQLTGVFDWGCSIYGDHLYELAMFEFWSPWTPQLDMSLLRLELETRWRDVGYVPENTVRRLAACYLHIGLDHIAYNAYLGDWCALSATAERMRTLVSRNMKLDHL